MKYLLAPFPLRLALAVATGAAAFPASAQPAASAPAGEIVAVKPEAIPAKWRNVWTAAEEAGFAERGRQTLSFYADKVKGNYGTTFFESEKRAYPLALFDFLNGRRESALKYLQSEDADGTRWHAHTEGIDFYPSFTLKGQVRKYFLLADHLDPAYRERMKRGARAWTEQDPLHRPHPAFQKPGEGWGPDVRNSWVDIRTTDNLRFMRDTAVYLFAEESGNEATRQKYKTILNSHAQAMYRIGMGEWDSENYLGHSMGPWLNVYDFARDDETRGIAKAALDWISCAAALKYWRAGWAGPTKRDYYHPRAWDTPAASDFGLWFGGAPTPDPDPSLEHVHVLTSAYRPPLAALALARKDFERPLEMWLSHPTYEHWKPGADESPAFYETQYFGRTFTLGTLPRGSGGDVNGFKALLWNSKRGVDFLFGASGDATARLVTSSNGLDNVAQNHNLLLFLNGDGRAPLHLFGPKSAAWQRAGADGPFFLRTEKTWLALHPIHLASEGVNAEATRVLNDDQKMPDEQITTWRGTGGALCGFALEFGEEGESTFEKWQAQVLAQSRLDLSREAAGEVQFKGANGKSVGLRYAKEGLPTVLRDGREHDWASHRAPYRPSAGGVAPFTQEWKSGTFRVEAGGRVFTGTLSPEGAYTWSETAAKNGNTAVR
jgi:hypothetical protein